MLGGGGSAQMACINWRIAMSRNNPRNGRTLPPKSQRPKRNKPRASISAELTMRAANALLIVSSALIDALGLFLLGRWLFGGSVRPFLGLFLLMAMRQLMQAICALPPPPNMIWHYPGFPSLLVTYHVANDFFFSGHTAIAVFGAIELSRLRRHWLTAAAVMLVFFEVATVLILRAHYTMDVFTGILAALWIAHLTECISPRLDHLLSPKN